ncbi:MAG TPA: Ku protein [Phycisphaerales bacterium]|nr:Ku protein [Phycisphaerales bacterium]
MPPRPIWKGHLRLSLVSFGVRLHNATSTTSRITFNQLHKGCNNRLKQKMVCPVHGEVERSEIAKGYEYEEGKYVIVQPEELEKLEAASSKTIDIDQFADVEDVDPVYFDAPYYVAPDGAVGEAAFRVVRDAMAKAGKVGIGRMVLHGAEHVISLQAYDKGFRLFKLRAASEVRTPDEYFEEVSAGSLDKTQLKLAEDLVSTMSAPFEAKDVKDRYQEALKDLIEAKIAGKEPAIVEEAQVAETYNFMDALKRSVAEAEKAGKAKPAPGKKKPAAKSVKPAAAKKVRKKA